MKAATSDLEQIEDTRIRKTDGLIHIDAKRTHRYNNDELEGN